MAIDTTEEWLALVAIIVHALVYVWAVVRAFVWAGKSRERVPYLVGLLALVGVLRGTGILLGLFNTGRAVGGKPVFYTEQLDFVLSYTIAQLALALPLKLTAPVAWFTCLCLAGGGGLFALTAFTATQKLHIATLTLGAFASIAIYGLAMFSRSARRDWDSWVVYGVALAYLATHVLLTVFSRAVLGDLGTTAEAIGRFVPAVLLPALVIFYACPTYRGADKRIVEAANKADTPVTKRRQAAIRDVWSWANFALATGFLDVPENVTVR